MNINKLIIAGRLGRDPELKTATNGTSVATFSVATNRTWKDKQGEKQEETEWTNCVAWGKVGEIIAKHFTKGKEIYLEGRKNTRDWDDKEGNKQYSTEMIVEQFQFVGSDTQGVRGQNRSPGGARGTDSVQDEIQVEDLPF